jgi:tripartite-type tricarboxylate transporter receptor subunit TctC
MRVFAAALVAGFATAFCMLPATAQAQDYPARTVKIVVPFLPGAGNDLMGRLTAEELSTRLGQSVIVENKAGAGSQIGIDFVAKSKPDGYTLIWAASDGLSILPAVKPTVPYKVPDDFTFIARITTLPFVVIVNPRLPIKSIPELIAYAKANPGKLRYGTAGIGSSAHMANVLIEKTTGIEMLHVPFSGLAAAVSALLGDSVDVVLTAPSTAKSYADAGTVRVLATTGKERHPLYPDVPTLEEAGVNLNVVLWYGVMAPAGTPEPVLARLRKEVGEMLKDPKVVQRLRGLGYQPAYLAGNAFRDFVVRDLDQWKGVAKGANIVLD